MNKSLTSLSHVQPPTPPDQNQNNDVGLARYANVYETSLLGIMVAVKETSDKKQTSTP